MPYGVVLLLAELLSLEDRQALVAEPGLGQGKGGGSNSSSSLFSAVCASVVPEVVCGREGGILSKGQLLQSLPCISAPFSFSVTEHKDEFCFGWSLALSCSQRETLSWGPVALRWPEVRQPWGKEGCGYAAACPRSPSFFLGQ